MSNVCQKTVCCFFSVIWNKYQINVFKTKCKLKCQKDLLGKLFLKSETPVFIFHVFITEIYLMNIWRDNWRFSIWRHNRTLLMPTKLLFPPRIFSASNGPVIHGSSGCSWWIPFIARNSGVISLPKVTLFILIVFVRPQLWQRDTSSLIARPGPRARTAARLFSSAVRGSGLAGWAGLARPVGQCHPSGAERGTSVD